MKEGLNAKQNIMPTEPACLLMLKILKPRTSYCI